MPKICIDAGHYGLYNPGAIKGYYESQRMWKLHLLLKKALEEYGIEVITTRANQRADLDLYERGRKAKGCDAFISLHSNAASAESVNYVVCMHQIDDNCKMDDTSKALAKKLATCVAGIMGAKAQTWSTKGSYDRDGNGYKDDYYGVLRGAHAVKVPGVIIEHGFHTNKAQADWLMKDANLQKLADAEAAAIAEFFGVEKKPTEFKVEVKVKTLRIRSGAGTEHKIVGKVKRGEVYTITKTNDKGTWGRLKSGKGWICIKDTYVKKI